MRALPMLIFGLIFLLLGIMTANSLGLEKSGFRTMFVLVITGWGVLIGWKIAAASGGQR